MTSSSSLRRMLAPRSIAFVGGEAAAEAIRQCRGLGFTGEIWAVHPHRDTVEGLPCYRNVDSLPAAPDAALIAVAGKATVEIVRALAARGAGGAVCHAAGFAEAGGTGEDLQGHLVEAAGDMAVVGPNCIGVLNYLDGAALWPDQHGGRRVRRGVAVITQSGNIGQNLTMQHRSLPLAMTVTVGNGAVTDVPAMVEALLADPRITAIGLHLETIGDAAAMSRAALAALRRGVPLVVLKSGTSELGARTNLSHTGSLAGADALCDALFARYGMARVYDVATFVETLKLLHVVGPLAGGEVTSASCSGGEAALIADLAARHELTLPELPSPAAANLRAVLGDGVTVSNPLDYHTFVWGDPDAQTACFGALLEAGSDVHLLVLDIPNESATSTRHWWSTLEAFVAARLHAGGAACVVSTLPEGLPETAREHLLNAGIAPMQGTADCLAAITAARDIGAVQAKADDIEELDSPHPAGERPYLLDEYTAKQTLAQWDLPVPCGAVADADTAPAAAASVGFPLAAKALSSTIAHKSDVGGVHIGLTDTSQVIDALAGMSELSEQFLLEPMVDGAVAELILGVHRDPQFGLAMTLGAGGGLVEHLRDTTTLLLPANAEAIRAALTGLRLWPVLAGTRGGPAADVDALVQAAVSVARYARTHRETLVELDVNPLLALAEGQGVVAVDALVRHDAAGPDPGQWDYDVLEPDEGAHQ